MGRRVDTAVQEAMQGRWGAVLFESVQRQEKRCMYTCTVAQGGSVQVQVFLSSPSPDPTQIQAFMAVSHPGLLTIYDYFPVTVESEQCAGLVQEHYSKTLHRELQDRARNRYPWKEAEMWRYMRELVDVMGFMQWQERSHASLSPHSLYITWDKQVKVGDWVQEMSELSQKEYYPVSVSNIYKADVYALGRILLNMCQLEWNTSSVDISRQISLLQYSASIKTLLSRMLETEESSRCDFVDLYCGLNPGLELLGIRKAEEEEALDVAEEMLEGNIHTNLAYTIRRSYGVASGGKKSEIAERNSVCS